MAIQVKLRFTFQEQFDEDLDVIAAFTKNPDAVRDALCEAICQVALPPSQFKLLSIANSFQSALQEPWDGYKPLRGVLEACRQKNYGHDTERLFHEHSQEAGVVALGLVAKHHNKLIEEIDALAEVELIKLAKLVKHIPKKAAIQEFIACSSKGNFKRLAFARPRVRSKKQPNATTPRETQDSGQETKKRRLSPTAETQTPLRVDLELPSFYEGGFSPAHQPQPYPPPTQRAPPNNQSHTQLRDHAAQNPSLSICQRSDKQQPSHPEAQLIDEAWDITESFMEGRPLEFPQGLQITDQAGQWDFAESFLNGRPLEFGFQQVQTGQGGQFTQPQVMVIDKWDFAESFLDGRPLEFS